jgi:hypothetical protein
MTLNAHKVLEQYFHTIINQPAKETTMFEKTKMFFNEQIEKLNTLLTKPVAFVETEDPRLYEDGYWVFEMYTPEWIDEHGDTIKPIDTVLIEPHDGTWMEVLDTILDAMEAHYGYNIKEQVYYSVHYPLNQPEYAGHGRCLNDERLQQILLAFPELYESPRWNQNPEKAMFQ